ncbi:uncharacterized protein PG998_008121 [Apiospora kogelbergensis]|uniref:uncharacterized protein n=1 Tax=Apiospora kogelbergensis TaxID=1337665 RepID=UPI00312E88CB
MKLMTPLSRRYLKAVSYLSFFLYGMFYKERAWEGGCYEVKLTSLFLLGVVVDDLLGSVVGGGGIVLVLVDFGGLDVVQAAGARLLGIELAAGPVIEVLDQGVERLVALEALLLIQYRVALLHRRLLPVYNLLCLILGHNVELARHVGNDARSENGEDGEEDDLEALHFNGCFLPKLAV